MDTIALVANQIDDGQKLLDRLNQEKVPVVAACWVKPVQEDRYSLYIATPLVEEIGALDAYRRVFRVFRSMINPWITDSDIKLISDSNEMAKELIDLSRRYPGRTPTQSRRAFLGNLATEDIYVYPLPIRPTEGALEWNTVKLKNEVEQKLPLDELLTPLTDQERNAYDHMVYSGTAPAQAEYLVLKRREAERKRWPIPAGTVVEARVTAWWGDKPEDDPNPLLLVKSADGVEGLTFKENTEPV